MTGPSSIDPSAFETVQYTVADHVATVRLNRPQRRNALNRQAYDELEKAFRTVQADGDVRCVILTGADPAFCAGEDVNEMMTGHQKDVSIAKLTSVRPKPTPAAMAVLECDRPVIAAVNGPAVGWGMELALFADIRIGSERAQMGEIFIKRGLISDIGGLGRLPSLVGASKAAELLFTGDVIDAQEAERIGILSRVVAHETLMDEANSLATRIAENAPLAMVSTRKTLRQGLAEAVKAHSDHEDREQAWLSGTDDFKEGVRAVTERRLGNFQGR